MSIYKIKIKNHGFNTHAAAVKFFSSYIAAFHDRQTLSQQVSLNKIPEPSLFQLKDSFEDVIAFDKATLKISRSH